MESPISDIRYIHKAIRNELEALESTAQALDPREHQHAISIRERLDFLHDVVRYHAAGEEDGLYPALDGRIPQVSAPYVLDHQVETQIFGDLKRLAGSLSEQRANGRREELARRLSRQAVALNATLSLHIWKEEEQLVPLAEKLFSTEEQEALSGRAVQHYPPDLMRRALPWMMKALTPEEQQDYLRMMVQAMPPEPFHTMAQWIAEGLSREEWAQLVRRVPELTAGAA